MFRLLWELLFFKPDIVYFEIAPSGFAFFRDSLYVFLCKIFRKKIVFNFQAKRIERKNKIGRNYERIVFKNTEAIILSKLLYKNVRGLFKEKNIYIVPNSTIDSISKKEFEKSIIEKENNRKKKKPILLFLSNMIESKGPLDVLEICNLLNNKGKNFECWFVGDWKEPKTKEKFYYLIKKYNLKNKCKYLGPKYDKEKVEILKKTNFMLFPTKDKYETFGIVIIESFMCGVPVLSYDQASIKGTINKDYLGYVSRNKEPSEIFNWLNKNLYKKQHHKKIRQEFRNNYELENSVRKLKEILIK